MKVHMRDMLEKWLSKHSKAGTKNVELPGAMPLGRLSRVTRDQSGPLDPSKSFNIPSSP